MIRGKVARVLNSRELVINRGAAHGVKEKMKFTVLGEEAKDITDPDTGEVLGSVQRPKLNVQVVDVQPRMSIARTYVRVGGRSGLFGYTSLANLFDYEPPRAQTLKTDEAFWQPITDEESFVKMGDAVVELIED